MKPWEPMPLTSIWAVRPREVLKKAAGSALLKDTGLVESILKAVVSAVNIPVTLKIRTGWCPETRNGPLVARIAEDAGIQLLTVHGRTRADRFKGEAEYDTIAGSNRQSPFPSLPTEILTHHKKPHAF